MTLQVSQVSAKSVTLKSRLLHNLHLKMEVSRSTSHTRNKGNRMRGTIIMDGRIGVFCPHQTHLVSYLVMWWCTLTTSHIHCVVRGTGTPKDKDEVNRRDVWECDGWVCDSDVIGAPSRLRSIPKVEVSASRFPHFVLSCEKNTARWKWKNPPLVDCASWTPELQKNGQFPDEPVRIIEKSY